jgi:hypothetical protein
MLMVVGRSIFWEGAQAAMARWDSACLVQVLDRVARTCIRRVFVSGRCSAAGKTTRKRDFCACGTGRRILYLYLSLGNRRVLERALRALCLTLNEAMGGWHVSAHRPGGTKSNLTRKKPFKSDELIHEAAQEGGKTGGYEPVLRPESCR